MFEPQQTDNLDRFLVVQPQKTKLRKDLQQEANVKLPPINQDKPIDKYQMSWQNNYKPLKLFVGQQLEIQYMEKQLNPSVE